MGLLLRQGEKAAPDTGPGPGRPGRRFAVLFTVGLLLVLGALYLAGYFLTSDRLPRDASVAGVEIGGLSPAAAREKLESDLVPRVSRPVEATHDGKSHEINPAAAGLGLDVAATVESAGGGRSLSPLRMIEVLTGGEDIPPVIETNQQAMDRVVSGLANKVERAPVEGTVRFRAGRAKPVYPTPGGTLDQDETAQALTATFLDEEATFDLPMRQEPAELTEEDVDKAMTEFAEPAMSGPVMVEVPGRSARITPAQISAALTMEPQDGELVPRLDRKKLAERTEGALDRLTRDARPAKVVLSDGAPEVVPGRHGTKVNRARLASNLLPVLSVTGGQERTIALKVSTAEPEFDTAAARKLGIEEPVSQFTTYFPHSDYRNTNLGRAAELISGTVLRPGETFSLND
ncbi:MAG: peptidoglycan binding domain-containing protein, partial [Nocardioidaceae bacterium]